MNITVIVILIFIFSGGYKLYKQLPKVKTILIPYLQFMFGNQSAAAVTVPRFSGLEYDGQAFDPYYREHIYPKLTPFELKRREHLADLRKRSVIAVLLYAAIALICFYIHQRTPQAIGFWLIVSLMVSVLILLWAASPIRHFRKDVKRHIFPIILNFFGEGFKYYSEADPSKSTGLISSIRGFKNYAHLFTSKQLDGRKMTPEEIVAVFQRTQREAAGVSETEIARISLSDFAPSGLVPSYTRAALEDIVTGVHAGVSIACIEARLYRESRDDKGRPREYLHSHALYVRLSMNKAFKGHTLLRADKGIFNWAQSKVQLDKIAFEDPRFEKMYEVYGSDQVEARYLLTPSMMERMQALGKVAQARKGIEAAFYDKHLLLCIPLAHQDWFEGGDIFTPVTFEVDIRLIFSQMKIIFDLIELLRLHEQTRL